MTQRKKARTQTPSVSVSASTWDDVSKETMKVFSRLGGARTKTKYLNDPNALLAVLLVQPEKTFGDVFSNQKVVDIMQLAAAAQEILDKGETVVVKDHERAGLQGFLYEVLFFAFLHVHYERVYEQYVGSSRNSFTFGWYLLCTCVRTLLLAPPDTEGCIGAVPGPPGACERCYDEKSARIMVCLVLTAICINDPSVKISTDVDYFGENSNGNKGSARVRPSREKEIAKLILGDLDASSYEMRRRFSDLLDEKFNRCNKRIKPSECETAWSLKPWSVSTLQKVLTPTQVDTWLLNEWDTELFWQLMLPLKEKFTRAPLEWNYIPTRSLVPLSYQGPVLLPHEEPGQVESRRRAHSQAYEATVSSIGDWFTGDMPSPSKKKQVEKPTFKPKPANALFMKEDNLQTWMNEVHNYGNAKSPAQKRRRLTLEMPCTFEYDYAYETTTTGEAELEKYLPLFQGPLGISNREMRPIRLLFNKMKSALSGVKKSEIPYLLLACVEAWCFVAEIFPLTAPPEQVEGSMANLRRVLLSHRFVFYEFLLQLKLDEIKYWEFLCEKFLPPVADTLPARLVEHFRNSIDEILCRLMWLSGSPVFVEIAILEKLHKEKAKIPFELTMRLDKIFHALLVRGGRMILDVSESHCIPYSVRYAAFDLFRHCVLRLPDTLLKDRHLDVLVICSIHLAARIFKEESFRLVTLANTCASLEPSVIQLWHQTVWRNIPLVCKPFQLHHLSLKQNPTEYGDITEFHNSIFTTATRTMCCALTRLAHPNAHMRSIQDVAVELSLLAPYTAGRMTRTSPLKMAKNLLVRYRRLAPIPPPNATDPRSLQAEVLGALGILCCCQLPDVTCQPGSQRADVTNFNWLPGLMFTLEKVKRRYKIAKHGNVGFLR